MTKRFWDRIDAGEAKWVGTRFPTEAHAQDAEMALPEYEDFVYGACHVREHRHDRNDEVIHVLDGHGRAVIDGADFPLRPGTTLFIGRNRLHMLINDSTADISWIWLLVPNGLEDFFAAIGRPRSLGEAAPAPFTRPADVLEIERHAGFAPPAEPRTR